MLRISKLTDYAIVIMRFLSNHQALVHNASDVAGATHIAMPTVSKLLKILAGAGMLQSQRGAKGGYSLDQPGDTVSIAQIIYAIEGQYGLTECSDLAGECSLEAVCQMRGHWQVINQAVYSALSKVTLADLAQTRIDINKITAAV